jgi:hypothetical protein
VEQAADAAEISTTTGYRYLPNQRALILAAIPAADRVNVLPSDAPTDDPVRVDFVTLSRRRSCGPGKSGSNVEQKATKDNGDLRVERLCDFESTASESVDAAGEDTLPGSDDPPDNPQPRDADEVVLCSCDLQSPRPLGFARHQLSLQPNWFGASQENQDC